jgi:uncharacterized metal-binding protein YceD (DUF177 family)
MKTAPHKTLKVKYGEIPQGGLEFHFSNESHELDEHFKDLLGENPTYSAIAKIDQVEEMTQLKGTLTATLAHICSRCAENFESQVSKNFTTLYYKSEDGIKTPAEGLEDLEGALDFEFAPGHELDLAEAFYEQLALEVPFQPVCQDSCQGLCGQCGINLNTEVDHSHLNQLVSQSPFAKLKELRGE